MNQKQLERMRTGKGFIAALDQSGGSTPKALASYGIARDSYDSEERMFELVHQMRARLIKSPAFTSDRILGSILFERTMDSLVSDKYTADFLWDEKGIVPFLKVDKGLADQEDGVQVMKPIPGLNGLLNRAVDRNVFGTKMRSVVKELSETGIDRIVNQQFETGIQIANHGLVPILEPEVDIHCPEKAECEQILLEKILSGLEQLEVAVPVIFKLTIPTQANLYTPIMDNPKVARVVALSGGYSRDEANAKLSQNRNLIASFSRALIEGLNVQQTDKEFNSVLERSIEEIYEASNT
jgi:fructose-bisphosphate aldolase class I